jgi:hypothetical protein
VCHRDVDGLRARRGDDEGENEPAATNCNRHHGPPRTEQDPEDETAGLGGRRLTVRRPLESR